MRHTLNNTTRDDIARRAGWVGRHLAQTAAKRWRLQGRGSIWHPIRMACWNHPVLWPRPRRTQNRTAA